MSKINIRTIKLIIFLNISIISLTACNVQKEVIQEETTTEEMTVEEESPIAKEAEGEQILIDYPFPYGMEGYTLALVPSEAHKGAV